MYGETISSMIIGRASQVICHVTCHIKECTAVRPFFEEPIEEGTVLRLSLDEGTVLRLSLDEGKVINNWSERVRAPAVGIAHAGGERSGHY
jgi:hypothetical protein